MQATRQRNDFQIGGFGAIAEAADGARYGRKDAGNGTGVAPSGPETHTYSFFYIFQDLKKQVLTHTHTRFSIFSKT